MQLPSLIIQALALPTMALALGINCRGSFLCHGNESPIVSRIQNLVTGAVNRGAGGNFYSEGKQIACADYYCAFFQSGASGNLNDALGHINNIANHGCKVCGSDPTQPGNDVSTGELTINYVSSPSCSDAVCGAS